ncbi:hypothetical protein OM076_14690 [Solirubrobacter ginsenosidimutans]|uniref:Uncharacterized protein n=1 Tax=Solirubrobacter ginsenosidimutans TaxID=490573 RepID=A0A9X3S2W6_9ACTN|nr:hypothetical protein [Solirubrobacter ginsenosidimutans]MDA0161521.1 hypothetical protein [Solirubrobacter ginsenosidimutans]
MTTGDPDRGRRFARRRSDIEGEDESLSELHSELVLLREENARLKAAEHRGPDIEGLLTRARSLSAARDDDAGMADETTKVLVEGLVIRESLLEICRQIERVMVSFEARLRALPGGQDQDTALQPPAESEHDGGGHWSEPPRLNGSRHDGAART